MARTPKQGSSETSQAFGSKSNDLWNSTPRALGPPRAGNKEKQKVFNIGELSKIPPN